ncbi:MAG: DUF2182 domain-containing protein, partial [Pseudomonadota bacterium]
MLRHGFPFRPIAWLGFFALILAAWWVMYAMAMDMGMTFTGGMAMEPTGMGQMPMGETGSGAMAMGEMGAAMPMDAGAMGMMDMTRLSVLIPMWVIMMAAMMGPTFVPTARTYEDLIVRGAGTRAGFVGLVGGYLGVWFGF